MTLMEAAQLFSPLIAVGAAFGILKKGQADLEKSSTDRHTENVGRLRAIEEHIGDIRESGATVRSELTSFKDVEQERHEKTDVAIDELKGATTRLSGVVNQIQVWQAATHEKMDYIAGSVRDLLNRTSSAPPSR